MTGFYRKITGPENVKCLRGICVNVTITKCCLFPFAVCHVSRDFNSFYEKKIFPTNLTT